jgi:transcription antitermination factor NusG
VLLFVTSLPHIFGFVSLHPSSNPFQDLQANRVVHDDILSRLTNLRTLSLMMNPTITDAGIATLTGLESLNIMLNEKITFPVGSVPQLWFVI